MGYDLDELAKILREYAMYCRSDDPDVRRNGYRAMVNSKDANQPVTDGEMLGHFFNSEGRSHLAKRFLPRFLSIPPIFAVWPRFLLLDYARFLPILVRFPRFPKKI